MLFKSSIATNKASKSDLRKLSSFLQKHAKSSQLTLAVSGSVR